MAEEKKTQAKRYKKQKQNIWRKNKKKKKTYESSGIYKKDWMKRTCPNKEKESIFDDTLRLHQQHSAHIIYIYIYINRDTNTQNTFGKALNDHIYIEYPYIYLSYIAKWAWKQAHNCTFRFQLNQIVGQTRSKFWRKKKTNYNRSPFCAYRAYLRASEMWTVCIRYTARGTVYRLGYLETEAVKVIKKTTLNRREKTRKKKIT